MKMFGFERPKAFQMETRRLMGLIGLVFATILLFQCVELRNSNARWSVFSRGKFSTERNTGFFNKNSTFNPVLVSDITSHRAVNSSNSSFTEDVTSKGNFSFNETQKGDIALPPVQSGNFSLDIAVPLFATTSVVNTSNSSSGFTETRNEDVALPRGQNGNFSSDVVVPPVAPPLTVSSLEETHSTLSDPRLLSPTISKEVNTLSANNGPPPSPLLHGPAKKLKFEVPQKEVLTLADMSELLIQSHSSPHSMKPRRSTKADQDLVLAKLEINNAPSLNNDALYAPLYRNASRFQRSYELMEQILKVYIYKEGDRRIFHRPPLEGLYASEGWFMKQLEENKYFVTKRPEEAHLFYLAFSSRNLEEALYVPNSHSRKNMVQHLKNYLDMISAKYPFWNRTNGADHFLAACHDWAPAETKRHMGNCIRALCNADVKEGFKFGKDVSLPETYVRKARTPLKDVGGKPLSTRKTLAFYAGRMHGYLRPILFQHWGNNITNDPDMQIFGKLPHSKSNRNYIHYMKSSKYCICPRGYEVNSPRVVEAIFYECVPVIISDNFVPPFFETLNWESFAVFVQEKDVPNLKNILLSIPEKTYFRMYMRVKKVQQHFLWHPKPVKYDLFHMILHSIWYNRVFQFRSR